MAGATLAFGGGERPDVVFVLVDDLRWDAFSFMGHPFVETPQLDRLRSEGAWMEQAFVTTSICCPSRATFLTGTYASRHGVIDNHGSEYVPELTPSFTESLREVGYRTAMIGKWHMGHGDEPRPGFDHWLSFEGQGVYWDPIFNINGERRQESGYTTDLLTRHALGFIEQQPLDEPYFLMLSHKAVHEPFEPAERHLGLWGKDREVAEPLSYRDGFAGKAKWQRREQVMDRRWERRDREWDGMEIPLAIEPTPFKRSQWYVDQLRCLAAVDDGIGELMKVLERRGTLERTVIVVAGDNGYFHGEHRRWDKRVPYEEAMRIPIIVFYPREIAPGTTVSELVTNVDFAPTILDYAGLEKTAVMQGDSTRSLLAGQEVEGWREAVFYEYFVDLTHTIPATIAVRTDRYKFVRYPGIDDLDELYDLEKDPDEMTNVVAYRRYAQVRSRMEALLEQEAALAGWHPEVRPLNIAEVRGPEGTVLRLTSADGDWVSTGMGAAAPEGEALVVRDGKLRFTGRSGLVYPATEAMNLSQGPILIEARIKAAADGVLLAQSAEDTGIKVFIEDGKPGLVLFRHTWIGVHSTLDAEDSILGKWTDLRIEIDWNRARLYVDGRLSAEMSLPVPIDSAELGELWIGLNAEPEVYERTPNDGFSGDLAFLTVHRTTLR